MLWGSRTGMEQSVHPTAPTTRTSKPSTPAHLRRELPALALSCLCDPFHSPAAASRVATPLGRPWGPELNKSSAIRCRSPESSRSMTSSSTCWLPGTTPAICYEHRNFLACFSCSSRLIASCGVLFRVAEAEDRADVAEAQVHTPARCTHSPLNPRRLILLCVLPTREGSKGRVGGQPNHQPIPSRQQSRLFIE